MACKAGRAITVQDRVLPPMGGGLRLVSAGQGRALWAGGQVGAAAPLVPRDPDHMAQGGEPGRSCARVAAPPAGGAKRTEGGGEGAHWVPVLQLQQEDPNIFIPPLWVACGGTLPCHGGGVAGARGLGYKGLQAIGYGRPSMGLGKGAK